MLIWVDGVSVRIEPGTCGQPKFVQSCALLHWAMVTSTSPKILQDPHCLGVRRFGFKPWVPESKERAVEILAWQGIVISFCTYTHTHTNIQITRGVSVALSVAQERHPLNTSKHSRYSTLWRSKNRVEVLQLKWFEKNNKLKCPLYYRLVSWKGYE